MTMAAGLFNALLTQSRPPTAGTLQQNSAGGGETNRIGLPG